MKIRSVVFGGFMVVVVLIATGLIGCSSGGGGGMGIAPAGPASSISIGTMKKGSVIVNGVEFTAGGGATIRIDDNPGRPETELRDGMEVKVKGAINADKITGGYSSVETEPEVRGKIAGPGVDDFTVNGQQVFTDDRTVFEDRSIADVFSKIAFAALAVNENVEIHGSRDASGRVHATRVERRHDARPDEVKGTIVTAPTGTTFNLATAGSGAITVNYGLSTQITPTGATLNLNDTIEVHGTFSAGIMTATRIDREDLEDVEFEPAEGQELEVEGFVSGFTASPGTFKVSSQTVQTTATTRFVGGVSTDLANGIEVEAEGHMTAGVLVADKIKFEENVRIEANAGASGSAGVLGKTVVVTSTTELINLVNIAAIAFGDGLRIRGFLNSDGVSFTATRVEKLGSPVSKVVLQGPVAAKTATTVTIAGITVDLSTASTFQDNNGVAIANLTQFLAKVTPGSTVVKAKGSFSSGTLTAEEAELEE